MTKTVLGIFSDREYAKEALQKLQNEGYNPKDVSIVMKDQNEGKELADDTGADIAGGAVSGATTGAVLGGIAGLLASFVIPGLGAFFIGGPIAGALGLTGAAASTASGAAAGALAGGLLGALMSFGLSEDDARTYEEHIKEGAILLAVPARDGEEKMVEDLLLNYNASNIRVIEPTDYQVDRGHALAQSRDKQSDRSSDYNSAQYYAGAKGGSTKKDEKGWHKDSVRHSAAAKKGHKGGQASGSKGRGWYNDSKEHSLAGQGKDVPERGEDK